MIFIDNKHWSLNTSKPTVYYEDPGLLGELTDSTSQQGISEKGLEQLKMRKEKMRQTKMWW